MADVNLNNLKHAKHLHRPKQATMKESREAIRSTLAQLDQLSE